MSTTTEQQSSEGHAASAAYLVTRDTSSSQSSPSVLDANGKLSSAGAATSLKHARAQDLPSFPSQGGVSLASAGAAASLAESNKKPFEHWKPGEIPAANKAAMQAKDYEMDPLWKPEMSRAGSKAAILAQRDTKSPDAIYTPAKNTHGSSAAGIAHDKNFSPEAITQRNAPVSDQRKALMAATGAMAGSRRRAGSAPIKPQASDKNTNWALQAATSSHRTGTPPTDFTTGDPGFEASRIQNMAKSNVNRQMYGSTPPVAIEVQEKNRQDMLKASAVAMARKMYTIQQSHIDEARGVEGSDNVAGARAARNRATSDASNRPSTGVPNYENLEEAARKLAQARLAKLHDEHAEYRQYYGAQPTSPPKSKLSGLTLRNRRNRASNLDSDDSDEEQSRRIKSQMSIFQSKLAEVDNKKRQADRDALLDAAHKNVTKQMNAMDEKVFQDTGKTSPQQRELWERQARERAQRDSDERMINVGKVHIGGGKYLDQSEIEAIAKAKLQPTLDDITDKAEKQRAHDEEVRLEQERQKVETEKEKQRQKEIQQGIKQNQQQEKEEERARRTEEKRVQREEANAAREKRNAVAAVEKERRQAAEAEQKEKARLEKEEKRKSKDNKPGRFTVILGKSGATAAGSVGVATGATVATAEETARPGTADTERSVADEGAETVDPSSPRSPVYEDTREEAISPEPPSSPEEDRKAEEDRTEDPTSPTSPKGDSKVKSWFKSRFRSTSKTENDLDNRPITSDSTTVAAVTKTGSDEEAKPDSDSDRNVAMAGRKDTETEDMYGDSNEAPVSPVKDASVQPIQRDRSRSTSISSLSSYGDKQPDTSEPQKTTSTEPIGPKHISTEDSPSAPERPSSATEPPATESTPSAGETQETSDSDNRGRKGFRQRLLKKVKRDKNKDQSKTIQEEPTIEQQAAAMPDAGPMPEKETNAKEEDDEARDTFAEEKLAPPPKLSKVATGGSPRGSRERSKFTEDL